MHRDPLLAFALCGLSCATRPAEPPTGGENVAGPAQEATATATVSLAMIREEWVEGCKEREGASRQRATQEHSSAWVARHWHHDWAGEWEAIAGEVAAAASADRPVWLFAYLACDAKGTVFVPGRDPQLAAAAAREIPASSTLWSIEPDAVRNLAWLLPETRRDKVLDEIVAQSPDPHVRAAALHWKLEAAEFAHDSDAVIALHRELVTNYSETGYGQMAVLHDPDRATAPGKMMPAFSVTGERDGRTIDVSGKTLRGSAYVVDLWATWCRPCVRGLPALHRVHADEGLTIVSLAREDKAAVDAFREAHFPMPWTHVYGEQTRAFVSSLGALVTLPTLILVDAEGVIVASSPGLTAENLGEAFER